jgi:hypothetical protein
MSPYEQFRDLKMHAMRTGKKPEKWIVGPGVIADVQKYMEVSGCISDFDDIEYLGVPMDRSVDLPHGRVTLKCGHWCAGGFTLMGEHR